MAEPIVVLCDEVSDELLAQQWLNVDALGPPRIERLPTLTHATGAVSELLRWERLDWVVTQGDRVICAVEFSRHGYTGDNGFQRFARLLRAAQLGIPCVYFTPFSRTRLNELDEGMTNARNVAPELFGTLGAASIRHGVPSLAIAWPTDEDGIPQPLNTPEAAAALLNLRRLIIHFAEFGNPGANTELRHEFPEVLDPILTQAAIPFRGSETRGRIELPVDLLSRDWVDHFLPATYFRYGKADKALASLALASTSRRSLLTPARDRFWERPGGARALFLGYQWRPDPSSGLIALTEAQRLAEERLVVVWPRLFSREGPARAAAMNALRIFKETGAGALRVELDRLGISREQVNRFRARVSVEENQFGIYTPNSKPGRILSDTRSLLILGDIAILYE